jgi:hypothetical protein
MKRYYFLVSSLEELLLRSSHAEPFREGTGAPEKSTLLGFVEFCGEQLDPVDFLSLRKLFLINDIKNALSCKNPPDPYEEPAFYDRDTFWEHRADPSSYLPFLARHFALRARGEREHPELSAMDEATLFMYQDLDSFADGLVRDFFLFELDLRNSLTALSAKEAGTPPERQLLPFGDLYERFGKGVFPDPSLSRELPYLEGLAGVSRGGSLTGLERAVEEIRWGWLEERGGEEPFSADAVLCHAVKLQSAERWRKLHAETGAALFDRLLSTIQRSIKFSLEFTKPGARKQ